MINWVIRKNLSEPGLPLSMVLRGVPVTTETTESVTVDYYFQFADDPTMKPQFLVTGVSGKTVNVPIDLKGRDILLTSVSKTKNGQQSVADLAQGEKFLFRVPTVAELQDAVYDSGDNEVTLTIADNRGTGTIHIFRKIDTGDFAEIATVDWDETTYVDEPMVDGDYSYKLTQDGQTGESVTRTVTVGSAASPVGSPPDSLVAVFDDVETISLNWSNHGGTGSVVVERKITLGGSGSWATLVILSSSDTNYDNIIPPSTTNRWFYYRVRNESVTGYSNEAEVFIPRNTI